MTLFLPQWAVLFRTPSCRLRSTMALRGLIANTVWFDFVSPGRLEEVGDFCAGVVFCASKQAKNLFSWFSREVELSQVCGGGLQSVIDCSARHRLCESLLSLKRWAILLEYCLLASLMPRDRFALVLRPTCLLWRQRSELSKACRLLCVFQESLLCLCPPQ